MRVNVNAGLSDGDIPEHIIESLAKNNDRNKAIASQYLAHRDRYGRTIIFAERWYQCERIAAILNLGTASEPTASIPISTLQRRQPRRGTSKVQPRITGIIQEYKRGRTRRSPQRQDVD